MAEMRQPCQYSARAVWRGSVFGLYGAVLSCVILKKPKINLMTLSNAFFEAALNKNCKNNF